MPVSSSVAPLTRVLAREHRHMQRAVVLLARFCARARRTEELDLALARQFLRFFRVYGECHLQREERVLFPWIRRHADLASQAALAVLLAEHGESRELLSAIEAILVDLERRPSEPESRACFCAFGELYARLLSEHDWKEDHLLYPLADYLDSATHDLRATTPDGFESCTRDPEEFARWLDDVEALAWDWPREDVDLHADPESGHDA